MTEGKLTLFHVAGFRSLRDVTIEPKDVTVLIGPNGAGKSNLLWALEMVRMIAGGILQHWRRDLKRLRCERFTTLFDLYGLPDDFPGLEEAESIPDTVQRAEGSGRRPRTHATGLEARNALPGPYFGPNIIYQK